MEDLSMSYRRTRALLNILQSDQRTAVECKDCNKNTTKEWTLRSMRGQSMGRRNSNEKSNTQRSAYILIPFSVVVYNENI